MTRAENYVVLEFLSRSSNEGFARIAAAGFAAQLDPTLDELGDIKTAVSEAVTNAIVHAYPDSLGGHEAEDPEGRHAGDHHPRLGLRYRKCGAGAPPHVHHRRQRAQRHGLHHHGELYRPPDSAFCAGQGHNGADAQAHRAASCGAMSNRLALLERAQQGDGSAEAQLLTENAGLIWSIVRRYNGCGVETDDLYQLGCIGFVKAVKGFDLTYGTQFSTYAVPKIAGEIRRFLRDDGPIKVGRTMREKGQTLWAARERLQNRLGYEPRLSQLAEETGMTPEEIAAVDMALISPESLQQETAEGLTLESTLRAEEPDVTLVERIALRDAIDALPEKERKTILLRFFKGLTQEQTARILQVSQVQVSRLERRSLQKLRELLAE